MKPDAFGLIPAATAKQWRELGLVDDRTLGQAFESAAHRWSDSIAVAASETHPAKMTLAQIFTAAKRVAAGLQALGVTQNDVVAVQLPGWLEAVVAHGAIALLGGTVVPIVHSFGAGELSFILRQSGAKAIITPGVWLGTDRALPVASVEQVPALRHHIVLGESSMSSSISWNSLASSEAAGVLGSMPALAIPGTR